MKALYERMRGGDRGGAGALQGAPGNRLLFVNKKCKERIPKRGFWARAWFPILLPTPPSTLRCTCRPHPSVPTCVGDSYMKPTYRFLVCRMHGWYTWGRDGGCAVLST